MRKLGMAGFTLIEIMIVVVIIAILAAIAMPSYRNHVCKVERNQAKADLTAYAQALERFYTSNHFSYYNGEAAVTTLFPQHSPAEGSAASKRFSLAQSGKNPFDKSYYKLTATKTAGACTDTWVYTLDSAGIKTQKRGTTAAINTWED